MEGKELEKKDFNQGCLNAELYKRFRKYQVENGLAKRIVPPPDPETVLRR